MKPVNRHLLIELPAEEPEHEQRTFLLPENYKTKEIERYTLVTIVQIADDCEKIHKHLIGSKCVVETSMIEEVKIGGESYNIIPENFVVLVEG